MHRPLTVALLTALLLSLLAVMPARAQEEPPQGPPQPTPVPTLRLPNQVDLVGDYEGQRLCDPTPRPGTLKLRDLLWQTYGRGNWAGISRDCNVSWDRGISEHKDGRAIDWGVSVRKPTKAQGDAFVAWATANNGVNARRLGIMYIIWDSRMWRLYDMDRGWTEYNRCISVYTSTSYDTTCHRDHVHISMTWHGAGAWTSWYDGTAVTQPTCEAGDPVQVSPGSPQQPAVVFEPLRGTGVTGGRPCFLGRGIQTLKVPGADPARSLVQRLRVEYLHANAPSPVSIWSDAAEPVQVSGTGSMPREITVPVGPNGLIYLRAQVGQASLRVVSTGQVRPLAAGKVLEVPVAGGSTGVPADAKAVALNVTVTEPRGPGWIQVFPCGGAVPPTSNVNFSTGQTIAGAVTVGVGAGGKVCVTSSAEAHVIVDRSGYFPGSSPLTGDAPTRVHDTRSAAVRLSPERDLAVAVPAAGAVAVSATVTQPTGDGWLSVYPCGTPWPGTSNINYRTGQTIAGSAIVTVGKGNSICVKTSTPTHVVLDLMGTIAPGGDFTAVPPARISDTRRAPGEPLQPFVELSVPQGASNSAVGVNVTVTDSASPGYAQVYPCGTGAPATSTVNMETRQPVANSALVQVGSASSICVRASASTHVIVDLNAALGPETFQAQPPVRLIDTRQG